MSDDNALLPVEERTVIFYDDEQIRPIFQR